MSRGNPPDAMLSSSRTDLPKASKPTDRQSHYRPGERVRVRVAGVADFGAFVALPNGQRGFIR